MIDVVGVPAHGLPEPGTPERRTIDAAEVLFGGARHLALVPDTHPAVRRPWPSPLRAGLPGLLADHDGRRVVALASGDPLVSGVGSALIELLGPRSVRVHPAVSSVALARARLGWSAERSEAVTLVGRDADRLRRELHPRARLVVLLSGPEDLGVVARLVVEEGYGDSQVVALADLGAATERAVRGTAKAWADSPPTDLPPLCLLAVEARLDAGREARSTAAGLPDEAFEHDGQLTKRHVRASALAHLAPTPGALLWDLGAGAGSIGIEWARHHPRNRVVAVERHSDRAARIARNAARLGVSSQVRVLTAPVTEALRDLTAPAAEAPGASGASDPVPDAPDAVFIGGGATEEVLTAAYGALAVGGRLVVHGVTAETEALLVAAYRRWGGELTRSAVETAQPLGDYLGWAPARTVVQWAGTRSTQQENR